MHHTEQDGRHSHHPSALPQGRGSATHCRRTQLFTSRTVHVPLAAVSHRCAGSRNAAPSHVSRETKAHPFHTGLDLISASYVVVDTEVGSRHIQPRPHRCTHLRRGSLLIEGRTWCQRADDTREILVSCELDSDTPLLRSTCHLDARIEGVGKTR